MVSMTFCPEEDEVWISQISQLHGPDACVSNSSPGPGNMEPAQGAPPSLLWPCLPPPLSITCTALGLLQAFACRHSESKDRCELSTCSHTGWCLSRCQARQGHLDRLLAGPVPRTLDQGLHLQHLLNPCIQVPVTTGPIAIRHLRCAKPHGEGHLVSHFLSGGLQASGPPSPLGAGATAPCAPDTSSPGDIRLLLLRGGLLPHGPDPGQPLDSLWPVVRQQRECKTWL